MNKINHYVIEVQFYPDSQWCYYTGYRTLQTLKKRIVYLREQSNQRYKFRLVARNYDNEVIKIYDI